MKMVMNKEDLGIDLVLQLGYRDMKLRSNSETRRF